MKRPKRLPPSRRKKREPWWVKMDKIKDRVVVEAIARIGGTWQTRRRTTEAM